MDTERKKISRYYQVPGLGEFLVAVWKHEGYQDENPQWACLVSNRSNEMNQYEDVLYVVEESLQDVQEQLRKIVPFSCEECG